MKKALILLFLGIFLGGCAAKHDVVLVGFTNTTDVLRGTFDERDDTVTVIMPDGEVLSGGYSSMDSVDPVTVDPYFGWGISSGRYARRGGWGGVGIGFNVGYESTKYALLKSATSDLKMEIIMTLRSWSKNGFGEAKTNDGRVYKKQY
jgi:hypothetical protein